MLKFLHALFIVVVRLDAQCADCDIASSRELVCRGTLHDPAEIFSAVEDD